MEKNCFNCKYYDQPSLSMKEYCWECLRQEELYTGWERKTITNADHIRSMSDEELAEFIARQRFSTINPIADKLGIDVTLQFIEGRKNALDWLKHEVDYGD